MRQDREPTGRLDWQVETSYTSPDGTGALSVAGAKVVSQSVAMLKRLTPLVDPPQGIRPGSRSLRQSMRRSPASSESTRWAPSLQ